MPTYVFENPKTGEIIEVIQRMNDRHTYVDEQGLEWDRAWSVSNLNFDNDPLLKEVVNNNIIDNQLTKTNNNIPSHETNLRRKETLRNEKYTNENNNVRNEKYNNNVITYDAPSPSSSFIEQGVVEEEHSNSSSGKKKRTQIQTVIERFL